MKNLVIYLLLFISINKLNAQYIEVPVQVSKNYYPDMLEIKIEVRTSRKGFDNSIKRLNKKTERVLNDIDKAGISKSEYRIDDFGLKNAIVKKRNRYIDSGYVVRQYVVIKMDYDQKRLTQFLSHYSKKSLKNQYLLTFSFSEVQRKKIKEELIALALEDAKIQLAVIEKESAIKSKSIESVILSKPVEFPVPKTATIYLEDGTLELNDVPGINDIQRKSYTLTQSIILRAKL